MFDEIAEVVVFFVILICGFVFSKVETQQKNGVLDKSMKTLNKVASIAIGVCFLVLILIINDYASN